MRRICVFCGSSPGSRPEYRAAAEEMGAELVRSNIGLVYGGGNVGLMGVLADAVLKAGGEAVGVIPDHLMGREIGHKGLTKLHVVHSMHETTQLGLHAKPCGVLNVLGFYTPLLAMFDHAVEERFLKMENRRLGRVNTIAGPR